VQVSSPPVAVALFSFLSGVILIYCVSLFVHRPSKPFIFDWLDSSSRWHDLGHYLAVFCLLHILSFTWLQGLLITLPVACLIEFVWQGNDLTNPDSYYDIYTYMMGAFCCI